MINNWWQKLSSKKSFYLTILTLNYLGNNLNLVKAQVIPDDTLGSEASVVNQINETLQQIEGGALRGENLFHSFLEFSINQGNAVYFANPADVVNIFSRVTGNNISNILGTLGVLGNANLYLLNPNGILFGPNASLDITGSFIASSGSAFTVNGIEYSAINPQGVPLLMVNATAPVGLILEGREGIITNQAQLSAGNNLTLAGNQLDLQGQILAEGNLTLQALEKLKIRDSVDNPFMAISGENLLIQGNQIDIFALNHLDSGIFAGKDLIITSPQPIIGDAHYYARGNFRVETETGKLSQLTSKKDPVIVTVGDVLIGSYIGTSLHIIAGGSIEIPEFIWITGADQEYGLQETITLSNGQQILIDGKNNPTLDLRAGVNPELIEDSFFEGSGNDVFFEPLNFSDTPSSADINLGTIIFRNAEDINQKLTGNVLITNQYQPNPNLQGNINLNETVVGIAIDTGSPIDGGIINIDSRGNINLTGSIEAISSQGRGGEITLNSIGNISLLGGQIDFTSQFGGNININANNLELNDINNGDIEDFTGISTIRAGIASNSGFIGAVGGDININVNEKVSLQNGSFISNWLNEGSTGTSGNININANTIEVLSGSFINIVNNNSQGDIGKIELNASNILVDGVGRNLASAIQANILEAKGNSGGISINTDNLTISNGAGISSDVFISEGNGGNIEINATDKVIIDGEYQSLLEDGTLGVFGSQISSNLGYSIGKSGNVIINSQNLEITNGSKIQTSIFGMGEAGNITINSENILLAGEKSDGFPTFIDSSVQLGSGKGGNLYINTNSLEMKEGAVIQANTFGEADAGMIDIKAENILITGERSDGGWTSISSSVGERGIGKGGKIKIETNQLQLRNGGSINAIGAGIGDAGSIEIIADNLILDGTTEDGFDSGITTQADAGETNAGNILINANSLTITNGASIGNATFTEGNGGSIILNIPSITLSNSSIAAPVEAEAKGNGGEIIIKSETIVLDDVSFIQANTFGEGNAGKIDIETSSLSVLEGSQIATGVFGQGNGGTINIKADDIVVDGEKIFNLENPEEFFSSSSISTTVEKTGIGNAGNIEVITTNLTLNNGGQISSGILGEGNGGKVNITAKNIIVNGESNSDKIGSGIVSSVGETGIGEAGEVIINTNNLELTNGGFVSSSVEGIANGGKLLVNANNITIDGETSNQESSSIRSKIFENAEGDSGEIEINTNFLTLNNKGSVNAETQGLGNAGNILINSNDSITLDNGSQITTAIDSSGIATQPSNINLNTSNLNLNNNSQITTSTSGSGDAGNINLSANNFNFNNSEINAFTNSTGNAGNIVINYQNGNAQNSTLNDTIISTEIQKDGQVNQLSDITIKTDNLTLNNSIITASTEGKGNAGNITILDTQSITLDDSQIIATTSGEGDTGIINLSASQQINLNNDSEISSSVEREAEGNSLEINISTPQLELNDSEINAFTDGKGNAGSINITNQGNNSHLVKLTNQSKISTVIGSNAQANQPSNITIKSNYLILENSLINASSAGEGDTGIIDINVGEDLIIIGETLTDKSSGIYSQIDLGGEGNSQGININSQNLFMEGGARISANTFGIGNTGKINLTVTDFIQILGANSSGEVSGIFSEVESEGKGNSQGIEIITNNLLLSNQAEINTNTEGIGNAGEINITANQLINLEDDAKITSRVEENAVGDAGDIILNTPQIFITNQSEIIASSNGKGNAAMINIPSAQEIYLDNSTISTAIESEGKATSQADIDITTKKLTLNNNAEITASTAGEADGGEITIDTQTPLNLNNNSRITSNLEVTGIGKGGNITINAPQLNLDNQSEINASTAGIGEGGLVELIIDDSINLNNNSQISTAVEETGIGIGGKITITTKTLNLDNQSELRASTLGQGNADSILVNADNVNINNSEISTETNSNFNAGNITLNLKESLVISGSSNQDSGLFGNSENNATGDGGSIIVNSPLINLINGGEIAVNSLGSGEGGSITISTENLTLNQGTISAQTTSGDGGDIDITVNEFLILRNNSQISTTAGNLQTGGNGGNIDIFARYIFAIPQENSDITANAFSGDGGQIFITTEAIFGIEPRAELTFLSDITASSESGIDGIIEITRLNVDPLEGLNNLPETRDDVQIAQGCNVARNGNISFYDIGKGGLPAQPTDYLTSDNLITPWLELERENSSKLWNLDEEKSVKISNLNRNINFTFSCRND